MSDHRPVDGVLAARIPDDAEIKTTMRMIRERDRYFAALDQIASCTSNYPGDVVDIARKALGR